MSMNTLRGLGWDWHENGVVLRVKVQAPDKKTYTQEVFVPLQRVWKEFAGEFSAVGCPLPMAVGEPLSVGGFFSSITHAVSSVAKTAAKATGVTAVANAAKKVTTLAINTAQHAADMIGKVPLVGPLAASTASLMTLPVNAVNQLASGGRIDRVALSNLKNAIANAKTIAPYAQTVLSFVPGVGQGLSGAIGASMALASGQSINDALLAGIKGALPGGPLAQAAFSIAADTMQGKPLSDITLNALPISAQARQAIRAGLGSSIALAKGQRVDQALIDNALRLLPPEAQKAIQIGAAIGHAKSLQDVARNAAQVATGLMSHVQAGTAAAKALSTLPRSMPAPPHLLAAVQNATNARNTLMQVAQHAAAGNTAAKQISGAASILSRFPFMPHVGIPAQVVPQYVGAPLTHHHRQAQHRRGYGHQVIPHGFRRVS